MSNYDHDGNERNGVGGISNQPDLNNFNSLDQFKAGVHSGDNLATARAKMSLYQQNNQGATGSTTPVDVGSFISGTAKLVLWGFILLVVLTISISIHEYYKEWVNKNTQPTIASYMTDKVTGRWNQYYATPSNCVYIEEDISKGQYTRGWECDCELTEAAQFEAENRGILHKIKWNNYKCRGK